MKNKFVKGLLAFLAVTASIAAAIAIMLKVLKKFFNISVEFSPMYENVIAANAKSAARKQLLKLKKALSSSFPRMKTLTAKL